MNLLFIVFIVIASVILLVIFVISCTGLILKRTYKKRGDGSISIRYQLPSELIDAEVNRGSIKSRGINLTYFTYKKRHTKPKALILVIHGIGFGHFYLLPIIQKFIDDGFMVIAYDQYASGCSEGRTFKTMTRGSVDIKYVLKFIEKHEELNKYPLYVFGHSWGGYVAGFSLKYSHNIKKVVDISGFDNEGDFARSIRVLIQLRNLFVSGFNSFIRVKTIFRKTTAKVYYLQGEEDKTVNPQYTAKSYMSLTKNNPNIVVELMPKKGHTPFNDDESQKEQNRLLSEYGMLGGVLVPLDRYVDFRKISKVDENVYMRIKDFYESN